MLWPVRRTSYIEAKCLICGGPVALDGPAVFQQRPGRSGLWIPVLRDWRVEPGVLNHPDCFARERGRIAVYLALSRDLIGRVSPFLGAFGQSS